MSHDYRTGLTDADRALVALMGTAERTVLDVFDRCRGRGVFLRPLYTARGPWAQARLWRQSRTAEESARKIGDIRATGGVWLAQVLEDVGAQPAGPKATDAVPGYSWHQWAPVKATATLAAIDVVWMVDGPDADTLVDDVSWSTTPGSGYQVWREEGLRAGLHVGPSWDWAHLQTTVASAPRLSLRQIDGIMREAWEPLRGRPWA